MGKNALNKNVEPKGGAPAADLTSCRLCPPPSGCSWWVAGPVPVLAPRITMSPLYRGTFISRQRKELGHTIPGCEHGEERCMVWLRFAHSKDHVRAHSRMYMCAHVRARVLSYEPIRIQLYARSRGCFKQVHSVHTHTHTHTVGHAHVWT